MSHYEEAIAYYEKEARILEAIIPLAESKIAAHQQRILNNSSCSEVQQSTVDDDEHHLDGRTSTNTTMTTTTAISASTTSNSTLTAINAIFDELKEKQVAVSRWIGDCHFARGVYEEAIRRYLAFLGASKSIVELEQVHCLLGKCYQLVNSLAQALVSYEKRLVLAHEIGMFLTLFYLFYLFLIFFCRLQSDESNRLRRARPHSPPSGQL